MKSKYSSIISDENFASKLTYIVTIKYKLGIKDFIKKS